MNDESVEDVVLVKLLMFDFDGVIADSEGLACAIAAAYATELGVPMTPRDGLESFMGRRVADVSAFIREKGGRVPLDFATQLQDRTLLAFSKELTAVPGVEQFLKSNSGTARCIASSSSHARLAASLNRLGLSEWFRGRVFSADDVTRGKPFPDLFLYAAKKMGFSPADVLVIEDSVSGVKAAVAAGMDVVGLVAGTHLFEGHSERLREAGAAYIAENYSSLTDFLLATKVASKRDRC